MNRGKVYNIYLSIDKDKLLKIETTSGYIKNIFDNYCRLNFKGKISCENITRRRPYIILRAELSRKRPRRLRKPLRTAGSLIVNEKYGGFYLLSTPQGSLLKIDYSKRTIEWRLVRGERLLSLLLETFEAFVFSILIRAFRIHAACIRRKESAILIIGRSGSGKTTLSKLLLKEEKESRVLADDSVFIYFLNGTINMFFSASYSLPYMPQLFFVEKRLKSMSKIYPISCKEAFKKIIFHSDVMLHRGDRLVSYRLNTLHRLVRKAKAFVLVNGYDLQNNSKKLKQLIGEVVDKGEK